MELLINLVATFLLLYLIVWVCDVFTNAVEHLGKLLNIADNAVGCIFAAIGTAIPETVLPLVAILSAVILNKDISLGKEIGIGAILGSPFLLSTLALSLVGVSALLFFKLKHRKTSDIKVDYHHLTRDFKFFAFSYALAIAAGFIPYKPIKFFIAVILPLYYVFYAISTIKKPVNCCCCSSTNDEECSLEELLVLKLLKLKIAPNKLFIAIQLIFALILLVAFADCFVEKIKYFSHIFNINPLVLSLLIAPIATELPEMTNSITWMQKSKDTLAVSNITGAMVFQSTIPFSIGIFLTPWVFNNYSIANIVCVVLSFAFIGITTFAKKEIKPLSLLFGLLAYVAFLAYVTFTIIKQ